VTSGLQGVHEADLFQSSGSEPLIVDYWATWCGPCKLISPHFAKMEEKYPNLKFAKVDVEEQEVGPNGF